MEKTEFEKQLDACSGGCAKIGCGLIAIPILIMLILMMLELL